MNYKDCLYTLRKNYLDISRIVLGFIIVIFIFQNVIVDAIECNNCHAGTGAVKALDTLAMDKGTCLKCHNPEYPPEPMGYNTHLTHVGKYSAKVDYITRHPGSGISFNCDNCHRVVIDCRECHVKDIPHIKGLKGEKVDKGEKCNECHGKIDNLFRHPDISIKIHDIFGDKASTCKMCHNPDSMSSLRLANDEIVSISESYKLCRQCHSGFYNKWDNGAHWANKTFPKLDVEYKSSVQDYLDYWENKWRIDNRCATCHNPHKPNELYWMPSDKDVERMTKIPYGAEDRFYIYVIGIIGIISLVIIIILIKKNKIHLSMSSISKLKLPKIPSKISLPISISIEENIDEKKAEKDKTDSKVEKDKTDAKVEKDKTDAKVEKDKTDAKVEKDKTDAKVEKDKTDAKVEKDKTDTKVEKDKTDANVDNDKTDANVDNDKTDANVDNDKQNIEKDKGFTENIDEKEATLLKKTEKLKRIEKIDELSPKIGDKKGKTFLHRSDVLFILGIVVILLSFYILFGKFIPIVAVPSESMSPNIETGDWVIYNDIGRVDEIKTNKDRHSESFNNYGDVIIYKPFGKDVLNPYIHRTMYYVQEGEEMWPGGPRAPHEGYITKGDNNPKYDQQTQISSEEPIKKEWIIGVAKYRIPYVGYINMLLSRN